ncbi:MAG: aminotransferase class I/II-fold pyridoxal phosphate-dependent enzyme [Bryobacteraceae bacterium]
MKQDSLPLYEACLAFLEGQIAPLYCPGHKGGRTLPADFKQRIADLDLNNLAELDTLHCPSGPIAEAERLLADAYGVSESFVLVGGSTSGNIASLLSVCSPGSQVLVQRNAHKSTVAGIVLAGADPIWLTPTCDPTFGIYHGVSAAQLDQAFRENPRAVAAVVLNPTYFGTVADIAALRGVCAQHGKFLLVDEAHGPHFHFHRELPLAGEDAGADLVVQSTHKILSGLSQAAVLHKVNGSIPTERVRKTLQLIQTTSPSFPVMISIDYSRWQMVHEGAAIWTRVLDIAGEARRALGALEGVRVLDSDSFEGPGSGFFALDPTKIVIDATGLGLSGGELLDELNRQGIKLELSGPTYVLAILTVGTEKSDLDRLVSAMRAIAAGRQVTTPVSVSGNGLYQQPKKVQSPGACFWGPQRVVPLEEATGCVCAEIVTPYPPGIPVLMPGEEMSADIVERLLAMRATGIPTSASDPSLKGVLVSG